MKKILVVIDMQNDFIDGPLGTPEARAIVPNVCAKIRDPGWITIIRTMDSHNENLYLGSQEGKKLPVIHCICGTDGWMINKEVSYAIDYAHLANGREVLLDIKSKFGSEALCHKIEPIYKYNDTEIHIVGVCTDICVVSNALLLKAHFPEARIIVDASCCAGTTPEMHRRALDVMRSCQIDIVNESVPVYDLDMREICRLEYGSVEE